jgi:tetratricopeptide (TPR) repeat protein
MNRTGDFILGLVTLIVGLGLLGWFLYRWLTRTRQDPTRLVLKWILTILVVVFLLAPLGAALTTNGPGGAFLLVFVAAGGLILALIWTPSIVEWVGSKFESLFTGGDTPPDPEPFYSIAQARRKQGHFQEAVYEVQKQLARFPRDVTGHLMLAEIQAEDLHDLEAAQLTIERFCNQPNHAPRNVWLAFNSLADWQLKHARDVEAARQALEQIIERLPDTEQANLAAQRIGHLTTREEWLAARDRPPIPVREGVTNVGLLRSAADLAPSERDPAAVAEDCVRHLEQHPLDTEAREKLAVIYADHYQRLDLAVAQFEQLIQMPHQPPRQVTRWLLHLADLQLKHQPDYESVRQTLQRIIDLNPEAAAAELARQRLAHLRLDLKGKEKGRVVKLGTYEQNIGLKKASNPKVNSPSEEA